MFLFKNIFSYNYHISGSIKYLILGVTKYTCRYQKIKRGNTKPQFLCKMCKKEADISNEISKMAPTSLHFRPSYPSFLQLARNIPNGESSHKFAFNNKCEKVVFTIY